TLYIEEIRKWAEVLRLAGVTSNPTIAKKEGDIDFIERLHLIRDIIGPNASLHVQVVAKDYEWILADAKKIIELSTYN
ncbi:transaldolase family protein, partial [Streptococcus suis]